jgi:hypothetical protein
MRKENSKYVERDGNLSIGERTVCSDLAGKMHQPLFPASQGCEEYSLGGTDLVTCCNQLGENMDSSPLCQELCNDCPQLAPALCNRGSSGGSTEDCSMGAKVSTSAGMVTCCETPMGVGACAKANGMSEDLAIELCAAFDTLSHSCIAIPGGESAKDRPGCRTQTIPVMGPGGMPGKPVKMEPDTYLNSSFNCNNSQNPEMCAEKGALQYFKACRKGSTGPPHRHHGGHKRKKDQPSPGPSPVTGQGSNKGGMSGGEIAGIVVGSVAGAILLLLAVGALLRGSGKKGKKK